MATPARHSTARFSYDAFDDELVPGERIGPPPARRGAKTMLRGVVILIALGGGWAMLGNPATWQVTWPGWLPSDISAVFPATDRRAPGPVEPTASAAATTSPLANAEPATQPSALETQPSILPPPASTDTAPSPSAAAKSAAPPLTTASLPPAVTRPDEAPAAPLPPPNADPADPYQMRAAAVGLHPGLSRVLLARLSSADYRNAGIAIKTALAETPESAVFVWPRQRKPELALFKVRFVPGAPPGCRRYVLTVTKDGWLTTALPMEKCGSQAGRPRREGNMTSR